MTTGPKQRPGTTTRGGARPGSGRKPAFGLSDKEVKHLFLELKREAKERGETWQRNFVKHLYSDDWKEAAAFHRMLNEHVKVTRSEKHVTTKEAPPIALPEIRPDPAKVVPIKAIG